MLGVTAPSSLGCPGAPMWAEEPWGHLGFLPGYGVCRGESKAPSTHTSQKHRLQPLRSELSVPMAATQPGPRTPGKERANALSRFFSSASRPAGQATWKQ